MHVITYSTLFTDVCSSPSVTNGHANARAAYFKTGHEVSFSCNEGFSSPYSTTTCQATRVWSPQAVCTEITCKVPHLDNGHYTVSSDNRETNERELYNTWIIPVCNDGYQRSSFTQRKCESDGNWSGNEVDCKPIICERLPNTFANGSYDSGGKHSHFPYNHEITVICQYGHYLKSPLSKRRCIGPNTWSITYPECRRITCRSPDPFRDGQYSGNRQSYDFKAVLVPTCNTGYYMSKNVKQRVCEQPDTWSGTEPVCEIVGCETPTVPNGNFTSNTSRTKLYRYRDIIAIQCDQGYEIKSGSATRTCQANGTWGQQPIECVKFLCNDTSGIRHAAITWNAYPKLAFGQSGNVTFNSTFFFLQQGSVEVTCSERRRLTWVTKPNFGMMLYCYYVS